MILPMLYYKMKNIRLRLHSADAHGPICKTQHKTKIDHNYRADTQGSHLIFMRLFSQHLIRPYSTLLGCYMHTKLKHIL